MSTGQIILLLLVVLGASAYALRAWSKRQRRKRLLASELSDAQRALIEKSVPLTRRLPPELLGLVRPGQALVVHTLQAELPGDPVVGLRVDSKTPKEVREQSS